MDVDIDLGDAHEACEEKMNGHLPSKGTLSALVIDTRVGNRIRRPTIKKANINDTRNVKERTKKSKPSSMIVPLGPPPDSQSSPEDIMTYRIPDSVYSLSSTFLTKSKVDRTDATASVTVSDMFSGANSTRTAMIIDNETQTDGKNKQCSPPTEPKRNILRVSNRMVKLSLLQKMLRPEFVRFWIDPFVIQHRPMEE